MNDDFRDAALLLVGHGSTKSEQSSATVFQHAAELRRGGLFGRVLECFWKVEPKLTEVLKGATARHVFIVPLFVSEGYFTEEAIPGAIGLRAPGQAQFARTQQRGEQTIHYCAPIGTHESMTKVLLARARDVVERHPFPRAPKASEIALFIAGHGTEQNERSRQAIESQVELVRRRALYAEVHAVFLEEEPRIAHCFQIAQAKNIVIVPFFMSDGLHVTEDIPVQLGEPAERVQNRLESGQPTWRNPTERKGKRIWYSSSIGTEPLIADVILERVREQSITNAR